LWLHSGWRPCQSEGFALFLGSVASGIKSLSYNPETTPADLESLGSSLPVFPKIAENLLLNLNPFGIQNPEFDLAQSFVINCFGGEADRLGAKDVYLNVVQRRWYVMTLHGGEQFIYNSIACARRTGCARLLLLGCYV
jgi:hypothetical protein